MVAYCIGVYVPDFKKSTLQSPLVKKKTFINLEREMAPKKQKRTSLAGLRTLPLSMLCEWGSCSEKFSSMELFTNHLKVHLTGVMSNGILEEATEYSCLWRDCEMKVTGHVTDFVRHVYFHSFHVKIKELGSQLVENLHLKGCQLDGQSHNLIPELPERLQCGWQHCETIMDIPEAFYRHVDSHVSCFPEGNNVPGGCKCLWEGCDAVSKSRYKLREHLRSHTQEKIIACPNCGGLFSNRTKFLDHMKRQEETDVQCYQCSHCDKRYTTERLLRDHVRHHVNQYKCPCCDMTCPTPSSLKSHLKYRHTTQTPYKCDHCEHGAKSVADLKKHLESHSMDVPYHCHIPECTYTSRTFQSLENHFKRLHQDINTQKYKCHVCFTLFTRGSNLTAHLKKKHKFRWPSGHSRFRYKMQEDGYWQLQTVRYESIKLTEQIDDLTVQTQTKFSSEIEEISKSKKKRRTFKKEKENASACSSTSQHNPSSSEQPTETTVLSQTVIQPSSECMERPARPETQREAKRQKISKSDLGPSRSPPNSPVFQDGNSKAFMQGKDRFDPSTDEAIANQHKKTTTKESVTSKSNSLENYNLEMLGDVALSVPVQGSVLSHGRTRKRKQNVTYKCNDGF